MKITDKMRLDWLQKNKVDLRYTNKGNWKGFKTLRQAIDTAIKSESKGGKV